MIKHGMSYHPCYRAWQDMKDRCYNQNNKRYKDYGARGITVCDSWLASFDNFAADMLPSWKQGLSLDRIENEGNYEPDNCRWATRSEQQRNKRSFGAIPYNGVSWDKDRNKFEAQIQINGKKIHLGRFDTAIEASKAYETYKQEMR